MNPSEVLKKFTELILHKIEQMTAETVVALLVIVLILPVFRAIWRQITWTKRLFGSRARALNAVARAGSGRDPYEGEGPWAKIPVEHPDNYANNVGASKILAVANYKGGVGKTTLAANIGACLAKKHNKKVLLVDLDFQGSLSAMAFPAGDWEPEERQSSMAARLISGEVPASMLNQIAKRAWKSDDPGPNGLLDVITAHYDLANADTRLLIEWLLTPRERRSSSWKEAVGHHFIGTVYKPYDLRYNLAYTFHSELVRKMYDVIIIDCPPRLTTGAIQALCASSHVMIAAIMDPTSGDAVTRYASQLDILKQRDICPHLIPIGIFPTKIRAPLTNVERLEIDMLRDRRQRDRLSVDLAPENCFIPLTTGIFDRQEQGIAYFNLGNAQNVANLKSAVEACTRHVGQSMGVPL